MANTNAGTVYRIDTSGMVPGPLHIHSIKYVGASSGTATIKADSSSGNLVWEAAGANSLQADEVCAFFSAGVYVTIASGAVVYIYGE